MKNLLLLFLVVFSFSCAQHNEKTTEETPFQKTMNDEFKDASKSPLKAKDLKTFEGLDFFPYDSVFVVKASLKRLPDTEWFNMNVYQGQELMQKEGFENYLFLPFLDNTNGTLTYGGGRYIDLEIPDGDTIEIDFNSAYNPYCAYNEKYSCPIVPRENYIDIDVEAGIKAFNK